MEDEIGVIGVGNIGFGISSNLLKSGFKVYVYDVRTEPLEELRKKGAIVADSVSEMARMCPVVFSVLMDYKQNLKVLCGSDGLLANMEKGGHVFVCSTVSPAEVINLSKLAKDFGISLLDAPVSGGAGTPVYVIGSD